jgi:succinate-semialdehyde dehydrogenase/glutarate-semialdehyde dehydrogenase
MARDRALRNRMYKAPVHFIDGVEIAAAEGQVIPIVNPATEERLGEVVAAGSVLVAAALRAAERGLQRWRATSPWERSRMLREIGRLMREREEELALLLTLEVGKPLAEARAEVAVSAEHFDWCADEARRIYGLSFEGRSEGSRFEVRHEPVGVVLALTAWNFPINLASRKLAMALAAGCAVILRPAEEAPGCIAALVRCCHDAGVPAGAVNLLIGPPEAIVTPLMAAPSVRKISFTGSTRVGQLLIRQSADTVKRLTMELGGHAPFIVLDDADVGEAAAVAVQTKFRNAGQVCTSPSRFFVARPVLEAFEYAVTQRTLKLKVGDGRSPGVNMGPLATERQRARSERLVADALAKGARLLCGGRRPSGLECGYFYEPTVLADVSHTADILHEEPFAPVMAIVPVADADEAVARANATEAGLASYLFTRSAERADRVSNALEAGLVGINAAAVALPEGPFGGIKQSGFGREGGEIGVREYLNTKFVHRRGLT